LRCGTRSVAVGTRVTGCCAPLAGPSSHCHPPPAPPLSAPPSLPCWLAHPRVATPVSRSFPFRPSIHHPHTCPVPPPNPAPPLPAVVVVLPAYYQLKVLGAGSAPGRPALDLDVAETAALVRRCRPGGIVCHRLFPNFIPPAPLSPFLPSFPLPSPLRPQTHTKGNPLPSPSCLAPLPPPSCTDASQCLL
jgi:hypothetical protein